MKNRVVILILSVTLFNSYFSVAGSLWHHVDAEQMARSTQFIQPAHYLVYRLDETALTVQLATLPGMHTGAQVMELPLPGGSLRRFRVWQTSLMPPVLAAKYPELQTFTGEAVDDPRVTAKLDMTPYGFHAMIFDGENTSFVDPYNKFHDGYYLVHYKRDEIEAASGRTHCAVGSDQHSPDITSQPGREHTSGQRTINGYDLRTYRLALTCDHFYAQAATNLANPTILQTLSMMTTTINRVNGIYERELSVTMTFVANEDSIIWTSATGSINGTDPFNNIDGSPGACLSTNQHVCDTRIGSENYDIGHVFTTGAGGLSQIAVVCKFGQKALSVTGQSDPVGDGFDVDYVAHEMGHEFGADHSFNGPDGNCGGDNLAPDFAYEPGSGSTIMAYAGICNPDDLQPHSDAYFHSIGLEQIQSYITTAGDVCASKSPTNNKLVSVPSFQASYAIPYLTPFELIVPAVTDSASDTSVTWCWEQWNAGGANAGLSLPDTHEYGPIFRSYTPVKSPTRIFPKNSMVLSGVLSNAGVENAEGEKAPDVARFLTFQLTLRDVLEGNGCFLIPDDTVHLDAVNTGQGFKVTSQGTPGLYYIGSSPEAVTWNVVGTNTSPINAANVDIYLSLDGGNTWQYHIGTFPNNGSAVVTLPNPDTDTHAARIKVKGSGNVFFNVNDADFTVTHSLASDSDIVIYPVPTHNVLRMFGGNKGILQTTICNAIGQLAWKGEVDGETDIAVANWAPGIYIVRMIDVMNRHTVRKIVIE